MANITFSSPVMARDVTVYAVAGDRGTILAVAKAHKIPIPFDCQDGECGSCLVKVEHFNPLAKSAVALTEKEKEVLKQLGKITKEEIENAEVNDVPPPYRLACQCFVRHEDILVSFEGDKTLPAQRPHVTSVARTYKGGMEINTLDEFFGYAAKVEEDAALHYDELAASMAEVGNADVLLEGMAGRDDADRVGLEVQDSNHGGSPAGQTMVRKCATRRAMAAAFSGRAATSGGRPSIRPASICSASARA